jgi:cobalamin biosynthesis protein CbiD
MLGFASIGELTFGGLGHAGAVIIVTGSGVTVSQGSPTISGDASVTLTGNVVTVSQNVNGITFIITGTVIPTGSEITLSTGASDVNVITWNPINPDASQTWTNIDPL